MPLPIQTIKIDWLRGDTVTLGRIIRDAPGSDFTGTTARTVARLDALDGQLIYDEPATVTMTADGYEIEPVIIMDFSAIPSDGVHVLFVETEVTESGSTVATLVRYIITLYPDVAR